MLESDEEAFCNSTDEKKWNWHDGVSQFGAGADYFSA
jgi:hypothetical protein